MPYDAWRRETRSFKEESCEIASAASSIRKISPHTSINRDRIAEIEKPQKESQKTEDAVVPADTAVRRAVPDATVQFLPMLASA